MNPRKRWHHLRADAWLRVSTLGRWMRWEWLFWRGVQGAMDARFDLEAMEP